MHPADIMSLVAAILRREFVKRADRARTKARGPLAPEPEPSTAALADSPPRLAPCIKVSSARWGMERWSASGGRGRAAASAGDGLEFGRARPRARRPL